VRVRLEEADVDRRTVRFTAVDAGGPGPGRMGA
jgi:hypothetical protein